MKDTCDKNGGHVWTGAGHMQQKNTDTLDTIEELYTGDHVQSWILADPNSGDC